MKKIGLIVSVFFLVLPCSAQDFITKKDGTDVKAKIIEVSKKEVKYKAWDNQDGPTFILPASEIVIIRFENGTNQVMDRSSSGSSFNGTYYTSDPSILEKGNLRYKKIKAYYNKEDYNTLADPRYGLGLPWLNLLLPGLGQYCMNEPGLGTTYLLLWVGSGALTYTGYILAYSGLYYDTQELGLATMLAGSAATLVVGISSIVNAYKVAKVKSLYVDDYNNYRREYSFNLQPSLNFAVTPNGLRPAPGATLRVTF